MSGYVYIIEAETGQIKIGFTGGPARARARGIQTGNAVRTRLVAVIAASLRQEKDLHEMLEPYHLWGEWYDFPPRINAYIRSLFEVGVTSIPEWSAQIRENKRTLGQRISAAVLAKKRAKAIEAAA